MKAIVLITLLFFTDMAIGNNILLSQLNFVNNQWQKQPECKDIISKNNEIKSTDFNEWIKRHLLLVENVLRGRKCDDLSLEQKGNRIFLLDVLHQYALTKQFPINDYLKYKNPIFIDRKGTHCAVGYLMKVSGNEWLAQEINSKQKFAYVSEISVNGVSQWANENGFTIDELAWIQPGYPVASTTFDLLGGLNGSVNSIIVGPSGTTYYVAGSFSQSTSGTPCKNIAVYQSGFAGWLWSGLSDIGLNGNVNTMLIHDNKLFVGGDFTMADTITANHVAYYDLVDAQWHSIGSLNGSVKTLCVFNNEVYAGGSFTQLLAKWNGTQWIDIPQGMIYGADVRCIDVIDNQMLIGGDFELATGALRKNVATYDGSQIGMMGFGTATPVNDFEKYNSRIYAACDVIDNNDTCALAVYDSFNWQTVIKQYSGIGDMFFGTSIKKLLVHNQDLYCSGNFSCSTMMYYGSNLMRFQQQQDSAIQNFMITPVLTTDSTISCLAADGDLLYFGGDFITNSFTDTLNHIGYVAMNTTSLKSIEKSLSTEIKLYPNPAQSYLSVEIPEFSNDYNLEVYDSFGRILFRQRVSKNYSVVDIKNLTSGVYAVRINCNNSISEKRFVKN